MADPQTTNPHSSATARFWNYVDKTGDCWVWMMSTNPKGYGKFMIRHGLAPVLAHRYAWTVTNGPIPNDLNVLHRCDNPRCVNPLHLFLGTRADNNRDMHQKGRAYHPGTKGERNGSAKLRENDVSMIRAERAAGAKLKQLATRFGISESIVSAISHRKIWKHVR